MYSPNVAIIGPALSVIMGNVVRLYNTLRDVLASLGLCVAAPERYDAYSAEWRFTFTGDVLIVVSAHFEYPASIYAYYGESLIHKYVLKKYGEDIQELIFGNYSQIYRFLGEVHEHKMDLIATRSEKSGV